jgi:hypothetical protein
MNVNERQAYWHSFELIETYLEAFQQSGFFAFSCPEWQRRGVQMLHIRPRFFTPGVVSKEKRMMLFS